MKVGKTSGSSKTKASSSVSADKTSEKPRISFTEILSHKEYDQQKDALQRALDEIDEKGQALVENRTVENLFAYKELIRGFIEETVHKGYEMREKRGFSKMGRAKVLRTVAEIDAKLVELTTLILKREHKEIGILKRVGEIQGLLVNLTL